LEEKNLIKYNSNFFHKMWDRIKSIFSKNTNSKEETFVENVVEENKNLVVEDKIENIVAVSDIDDLVSMYEAEELREIDMTAEERAQLIEYYEKKNEELDREILRERAIWKSKVKQLEKAYERLKKEVNPV